MRADADADRGGVGEAEPGGADAPVGRGPELRAAEEALRATGAVLLSGPAGIGRSVLAAALADRAARAGAVVLRCAPSGEESALPYVGLVDLFADLPERRLDELLDGLAEGRREALRDALLRGRRPDSDLDRLALRVGVLQVLRTLAQGPAGLLLVLDGLQWLDGPTAEVLGFVLRRTGRLGVRILATERTGPGSSVLGSSVLGSSVSSHRAGRPEVCPTETVELVLPPLGPAATAELLVRDRRGPLPAAVLRDVQQVAAGNPRHALELARVGFRLGADGAGPVPQRLRRLVLDQLRDLSGEQRRALLLVAASFCPTVAELRTAVGGDDPLLLLAPALRSGLVELDAGGGEDGSDGGVGRVGFGDPLARVVLLAEAAPNELAAARRSLAAAAADPGERACQLALSRPGEPDEQTAAALAAAATRARDRGAGSEAYRLARLAVRHTPAEVTVAAGVRADRLLTAATYAWDAGRWQEARALAAELLDATPPQAVVVRTRARVLVLRSLGQHSEALRELIAAGTAELRAAVGEREREREREGEGEREGEAVEVELESELRRWSAERALSAGWLAHAADEAALAAELAASVGDSVGQAAALAVLSTVQTLRGRLVESRRTLAAASTAGAEGAEGASRVAGPAGQSVRRDLQRRQAVADLDADRASAAVLRLTGLARSAPGDAGMTDAVESLVLLIRAQATAGEAAPAMASATRLRDLLAGIGSQPEAFAAALTGTVRMPAGAGPTDPARSGQEAGAVPTIGAGPVLHAQALAELAGGSPARAGQLASYAATVSAAEGDRVHQVRALGTVGAVHLVEGNAVALAAGVEALQEARRLGGRLGMADPDSVRRLAALAESLVALGEYGEATKVLAEARWVERGWGEGFSGSSRAAVDRAEGLAQAGLGNSLQAAFLLRGAVERLRAARLPLDVAWTLMAVGSVERRSRHRAAARAALVQAREICAERLALPLLARIERELERLEHGGGGPGADGARLTASEHRVAGLAADGATNREVAAALFVSVKTVEGTLSRVYRKLGVRSRAALARALAAQG
ncbi:DNA-binding CsgD family transcriptional regulator [Kitasatospora sp. MAA4]|uniref:helix-turn-helix transcriptional regulator n=1 Tax=Kitasatospora sp. MAA4 TaxID=3035093 RepID=UPI0024754B65|nr:LuxR family transcriptional regulator [Kitasatospora sp. MAA4]MDH6134061.1 DNA-binding CsgD family transcriptional regulator [Kitasatospora sp. MAA4]